MLTGNENESISLPTAASWTKNYRNAQPISLTPATIGYYFSKDAITGILNQQSCVGIRIYYALDQTGKNQLVIVGVDANANDLYKGLRASRGLPCPSTCSNSNPLNT